MMTMCDSRRESVKLTVDRDGNHGTEAVRSYFSSYKKESIGRRDWYANSTI